MSVFTEGDGLGVSVFTEGYGLVAFVSVFTRIVSVFTEGDGLRAYVSLFTRNIGIVSVFTAIPGTPITPATFTDVGTKNYLFK